jgi:hypothetical protein
MDTKTTRGAHAAKMREEGKHATYYNPVLKQKYKFDVGPSNLPRLEYRTRGSIGGNLLFPEGNTSTNTAETPVIKSFLNAVVSSGSKLATMDIRDFLYLGTDLPEGKHEYMWVNGSHLTDVAL